MFSNKLAVLNDNNGPDAWHNCNWSRKKTCCLVRKPIPPTLTCNPSGCDADPLLYDPDEMDGASCKRSTDDNGYDDYDESDGPTSTTG